MELVQNILENNGFPVITAFLLGLIVALHPCPLAANIAAMGYIAKDAHRPRSVFVKGLAYTFGRLLTYSLLGIALVVVLRGSGGVDAIGRWFGEWGERLLAPVLILIGLYFILDRFLHRHEHCPTLPGHGRRFGGAWGSLLLGVLLALSFCPESAIVYFGMLLPLAAAAQMKFGYLSYSEAIKAMPDYAVMQKNLESLRAQYGDPHRALEIVTERALNTT